MSRISTENIAGNTVILSPHAGPEALTDVALYFAHERLEAATAMYERATTGDYDHRSRIRKKYALKALRDAIPQIQAAIALIEMEA